MSDGSSFVGANQIRARQLTLTSRLQAEPGVSAVTFSSSIPGFAGDRPIQFENRDPVQKSVALEVAVHVEC